MRVRMFKKKLNRDFSCSDFSSRSIRLLRPNFIMRMRATCSRDRVAVKNYYSGLLLHLLRSPHTLRLNRRSFSRFHLQTNEVYRIVNSALCVLNMTYMQRTRYKKTTTHMYNLTSSASGRSVSGLCYPHWLFFRLNDHVFCKIISSAFTSCQQCR